MALTLLPVKGLSDYWQHLSTVMTPALAIRFSADWVGAREYLSQPGAAAPGGANSVEFAKWAALANGYASQLKQKPFTYQDLSPAPVVKAERATSSVAVSTEKALAIAAGVVLVGGLVIVLARR